MKHSASTLLLLVAASTQVLACKPDFDSLPQDVQGPRVLAVTAEPAEVLPGDPVRLSALVVDAKGRIRNAALDWAFCAAAKPLIENNTVNEACLALAVRPIGISADPIAASIPPDACALFGPDVPPDGSRPRDPDTTGGFYQPVRAFAGPVRGFGMVRVQCNLANAPVDVARAYKTQYQRNKNPGLKVELSVGGRLVDNGQVPPGAAVTVSARWQPSDAETFVVLDAVTQTLVTRRESLRASFFSNAGSFADASVGRAGDDLQTDAQTVFTAPVSGAANLWVVLRDDRGGQTFAEVSLQVTP